MRERGTNQARGFGFCDYMEPWQVEKALQILHKQLFRGRPLRFDRVSNKKVYFELLSTVLQSYIAEYIISHEKLFCLCIAVRVCPTVCTVIATPRVVGYFVAVPG